MTEPIVALTEPAPGVVQIQMQDRAGRNGFSRALLSALGGAFAAVHTPDRYKVVVLTGYDNFFSSGGTREALLDVHQRTVRCVETGLYSMALMCPIPVIAAMQGHAIGGGFVLGLFADVVVLARESVYTTNFMKYGFTPGMGATYIVPKKLGLALAEEMLISARTFRGAELERRGIPFAVLPRADVATHALDVAVEIAEKPRLSLVTLKDQLVAGCRRRLPAVIEREVAMHDQTFTQAEVGQLIATRFGR